jgi:ribosomal protein L29
MSKELKKKSDQELNKALEEKRKSLLDLRFNMSGSAKRGSKKPSVLKKEIAQMLTEQKLRTTTK